MRPNTASIAEMVSAAVLPASRAASVTRADRAKTHPEWIPSRH
jgi:hypothetical protein